MVATEQMNIKNRTYYFYDDLINITNFDPGLLKLHTKNLWTLLFIALVMLFAC